MFDSNLIQNDFLYGYGGNTSKPAFEERNIIFYIYYETTKNILLCSTFDYCSGRAVVYIYSFFNAVRHTQHPYSSNLCYTRVKAKASLSGVSPGCHAHLLERHVSKTALFAWNEEEREGSSFTMVKLRWRCFPRGETGWNPHWGLNRFTILHVIQSFCSN